MSVQLQSWLQDRLGVTVPLMGILRGPSLRELSVQVVEAMRGGGANQGHPWLVRLREAKGRPTARLFCFAYMTADEDAYAGWAAQLDPSVELWRVSYPELGGEHDALVRGPAEALRQHAADALAPMTDLPFAFYGHSMGGYIALDLARELETRGKAPRFVAAGALPTPEAVRAVVPSSSIATPEEISEDLALEVTKRMQFADALIEEPAFRALAVARTRRDVWLGVQAGVHRDDWAAARPQCPLWLFGGADDAMPTADKQPPKGLQPQGVEVLPGGHLFVEEPNAGAAVARKLSGWLTQT
jgi:surfactin synthase thioesterase subunit